jgi:hypothetical protein
MGLSVNMSKIRNAIVKINDHTIPTKKKPITKVVIKPAMVPSQVLFLFQDICDFPYLIPIWLVIKSLIDPIPSIAKNTIGGQTKAAKS